MSNAFDIGNGRFEPMDIDAFAAFVDLRPETERWELVEGDAVMSPSPHFVHQVIVANIVTFLREEARRGQLPFTALASLGVRMAGLRKSVLLPDVVVRPATPLDDWKCDDPLVLVEVLSPGGRERDLGWKRINYPRLPTLLHYLVVAQDTAEVTHFARSTGFAENIIRPPVAGVDLTDALGLSLPLDVIYRETGLVSG
jgi:Uma2 family endonuclease